MKKKEAEQLYYSKLTAVGNANPDSSDTISFLLGGLGFLVGIPPDTTFNCIMRSLESKGKTVSESEVWRDVLAGNNAAQKGEFSLENKAPMRNLNSVRDDYIRAGEGVTVDDIIDASPVPLDWPAEEAAQHLIEHLYTDTDYIFAGEAKASGGINSTIRTKKDWLHLPQTLQSAPHFIPNPLSGKAAEKKTSSDLTMRGDANVVDHRFVVAEFDTISLEDQLAFWWGVPHLPVAAIIFSGNKSLHALLKVDAQSSKEWDECIKKWLFPEYLTPLGLDKTCCNPSRMSRLPGHMREDTGCMQKLLYLAPEGRAVNP